jgi:hydroxyethylthiazole kinase
MTNDVVQTFTANVLLALGASPAMVIEAEEAEQFAAIADALLVNVGTLTSPRAQSMRRAIESAVAAGKPWTLDPVAVGALTFRTRFCHQILALKPAAIDTTDTAASAVSAAQALARQTNAVVVVTGEVDYITDGQRTRMVTGGDPLMTRVVGTGCALSAVVAASCSLPGDRMDNVAAACGWMKRAGTVAVAQSLGPGSFASAFLDALYTLEEQA